MKKVLFAIPLLLVCASTGAVAEAQERVPVSAAVEPEGPLPPGLDENLLAEWRLRDFEGRWVLWKRLVADADHEAADAWHQWLIQHGEFDLLERDALDDESWMGAAGYLFEADAPQWVRLAHWHMSASDSHTFDAAKTHLESAPKLTLAWIEAHPGLLEDPSTKRLYDGLAKDVTERRECSKYSPPYEADRLYAPLLHAGDGLVDFGDRLVASASERYVHQTLHAMQVLAASNRRPAIWQRRLFDLASAKNLEVRLAALRAATRLDPESLPWPEFRALFDSRGEPDAVRGAAWIALTYAPRVVARRNYLEVLSDLSAIEFSEVLWILFTERLPEVGGWYENQVLHEQPESLRGSVSPEQFIETVDRMMRSWDMQAANNIDVAVQSELELFAYLRAQHEGLQNDLGLERRPGAFRDWISQENARAVSLLQVSQSYVPASGVFPGGERAAVDGAARDEAAWKRLVIREAERLLAR